MNTLKYKGYIGSIEASLDDNCLYGKVLHIRSLILYEAKTVLQLEKAFKNSVDDYLADCEQKNIEPNKPFKGSLNIRIGEMLHKSAAQLADRAETSLNEYIRTAVANQVEKDKRKPAR